MNIEVSLPLNTVYYITNIMKILIGTNNPIFLDD